MGVWFQCDACVFGTNSPSKASKHSKDTLHTITEEED